jgi:hypothetical protein
VTRTSELLIGLGLFAIGMLGLAMGAVTVGGESTGRLRDDATGPARMGGIVLADDGNEALKTNPESQATSEGPGEPTGSLEPIGPAERPAEPEVSGATLEVEAHLVGGDDAEDNGDRQDDDNDRRRGKRDKVHRNDKDDSDDKDDD